MFVCLIVSFQVQTDVLFYFICSLAQKTLFLSLFAERVAPPSAGPVSLSTVEDSKINFHFEGITDGELDSLGSPDSELLSVAMSGLLPDERLLVYRFLRDRRWNTGPPQAESATLVAPPRPVDVTGFPGFELDGDRLYVPKKYGIMSRSMESTLDDNDPSLRMSQVRVDCQIVVPVLFCFFAISHHIVTVFRAADERSSGATRSGWTVRSVRVQFE